MQNYSRTIIPIIFGLMFTAAINADAQLIELKLDERIDASSLVVEGTVIDQASYWDNGHRLIYTSNMVSVSRLFKGTLDSVLIEVITEGGTVDDMQIRHSETLELHKGDRGVFLCIASRFSGIRSLKNRVEVYSSMQGFLRYSPTGKWASDPFRIYPVVNPDLYRLLEKLCNHPMQEMSEDGESTKPRQIKSGMRLLSAPTITSFSPSTLSAGTDSVLVITGTNFGSSRGTGAVMFRNVDDGGSTFVAPLSSHYLAWSNTSISVKLPSGAGTGTFYVRNSDPDSVTSSSSLTVPYSLSNATFYNTSSRTRFVNRNENGGITWQFYTGFNGYKDAKASFLRAFTSWRNGTGVRGGVNWDIGPTTSTNSIGYDGICVIRFDVGSELPSGVLGRCTSYWSKQWCGSTDSSTYVTELDVCFDSGRNWYFGTGTPGGSQYDFESIALHELGHGHQLAHVINSSALMHWSYTIGTTRRTLSSLDTAAGNNVLRKSFATATCGPDSMRTLRAFAGSDVSTCLGSGVTLRAYGGITYQWNTSAADTLPTLSVTPSSTTDYIVTVNNGSYTGSDTVRVSVFPAPTANAGTDGSVCPGDSLTLGASTSYTLGNVGAGTLNLASSPFNTSVEDQRTQMLFWASELRAAGLTSGYITHLAFNVVSVTNTKPMSNIILGMKNVSDTTLMYGFVSSTPTAVLSRASYNPGVRWDTLYLDTPFLWDGVSNLVVQTCFDNTGTASSAGFQVQGLCAVGRRVTYKNGSNVCDSAATYVSNYRPNVKFFMQPNKYEWSPSSGLSRSVVSAPRASPSSSTNYLLTVTDSLGCTSTDNVYVIVPVSPVTRTWTGAVSTAWGTAGNWNPSCSAPSTGDTVIVPAGITPPASMPAITLGSLTISNASGLVLSGDVTVNGVLALTGGKLYLGSSNLTIGESGSITGANASRYVVAPGPGTLRKVFSGNGSFTYPVGDTTGTAEYSPITLSFTSGSFGTTPYAGVTLTNKKHSGNPSTIDYLNRYWTVTSNDISTFVCNVTGSYVPADVTGFGSFITAGKWNGTSWTRYAAADTINHNISAVGVTSFSDFTGGDGVMMDRTKLVARIKVFLQGPWNGLSGMTTNLNPGAIPHMQPYNSPWSYNNTWHYAGNDSVTAIPSTDITDWVLLELRSTTDASSVIERRAAFLKSDGTVVDVDGRSPVAFRTASPGSYHLVVYHRNHIPIMTSALQAFSQTTSLYDFTTALTQAYGTSPMEDIGSGGPYAMIAGDYDPDGYVVYSSEESAVWNDGNMYVTEGYYQTDFDMDGYIVYTTEESMVWNNNGKCTQVP